MAVQVTAKRKRKPISRLKKHEVQVLLRAGHRQNEVAELTSVSLRTVQRVAKAPAVTNLEEPLSPPRSRLHNVESLREPIVEWLSATPNMDTVEVLTRARAEGYDGGKTALYSLVRSLRHTSSISDEDEDVSQISQRR